MVRDFHVGADKWIGYYAGLLLTGFWGANLATTLFWGYLSDKYGRKAVMLFGLFMTSVSTVYLGLSTCYHDAMWALVIQGACTGLVPVAKCSIGELANRQQQIHNTEVALAQKRQQRHRRRQQSVEWEQEKTDIRWRRDCLEGREGGDMALLCSEPDCDQFKAPVVIIKAREDYASKGYSALVIALALGAALGPMAGGVLTKKMTPGFEAFLYFAPCLLASVVGLFLTGVVALVLNETHPKWAKSNSELEVTLATLSRLESMDDGQECDATGDVVARGRSGYENSRHYRESTAFSGTGSSVVVDGKEIEVAPAIESTDQDVVVSLSVGATTTTTTITATGARSRLRQTTAGTITPTLICTCPTSPPHNPESTTTTPTTTSAYRQSRSRPKLSPATELYLTLAIYTLLVLTSILGSEFIMLYTQSPIFRGGLEFSAKTLGQILTLRGILKLGFTLWGYPRMVRRWGLLRCLRLGIVAIGTFSVVGLGWFVPWTVAQQEESRAALLSATLLNANANANAREAFALTAASASPAAHANESEGGSKAASGDGMIIENTPVGMSVILLCLSLISFGDVLGYVSVLVLFGKSADRMKRASSSKDPMAGTENDASLQETPAAASGAGARAASKQGGSGVLWSVAQVSGNVMRLTGPVLAG
ncbi:hypothetical protein BGX33_011514 [Mortierella sp. NVP41]|nr:hypothetical protein BGX33_011514 [Mortierella sp. NVP41]